MADRRSSGFWPVGRGQGSPASFNNPTVSTSVGPASRDLSARDQATLAIDSARERAIEAIATNQPVITRAQFNAMGPAAARQEAINVSRASDAIARRGANGVSIGVQIDLKPLAAAFRDIDLKGKDTIVYRSINDCLDRFNTQLKRLLQEWTGIKVQRRITQGMTTRHAFPGKWEGYVMVRDKYIPITAAYFGAKWNRSMPGVSHNAWNRAQIAKGAFMIPGRQPAFHRVGPERFPIKVVWGPNPAREVERHAGEVQKRLDEIVGQHLIPRITHHVRQEFERVKAKFGL